MQPFENLLSIYSKSTYPLSKVPRNDLNCEDDLIQILNKLSKEEDILLFKNDIFDHNEASKLFRIIEDNIKESFEKTTYLDTFESYCLTLDIFNSLCLCISTKKGKKENIKHIIESTKESINILKFSLPLGEKEISILNTVIGRQLYYLTHINYVDISFKEIDYILDEYYMYLEKQMHGYELSHSSTFLVEEESQDIEKAILINNSSFLLLKMIYKIKHFKSHVEYKNHKRFYQIKELFKEIISIGFDNKITNSFSKDVMNSFIKSGKFLENNVQYNIINEKIKLLTLNTDEYKELVDIIISSKEA